MHKIFTSIILTSVIYCLIATCLIFLPFERNQSDQGLDFEVLSQQEYPLNTIKERHYTARDSSQLFYRYIEGDSDISIILLHGSGTEGRYLVPLAQELSAESGVTIIIPDLRGHGRSQGSTPGDVKYLGQLEHDLEDLIVQIKSTLPNSRILVGGHSSGGGLVIKFGGNSLSKFDGAVLLAPYLGYQSPTVRPDSGGWVQVAKLRYVGLAMLNNIGVKLFNHYPVLFFNRPARFSDEWQLDSYSYRLNESLSPQSYESDLTAFKNPILLLIGEQDEAFYPQVYQQVLEENAPHTEFHILANTQHLNLPSSREAALLISQWLNKTYKK
jgi:non-heme chloroperoxidase